MVRSSFDKIREVPFEAFAGVTRSGTAIFSIILSSVLVARYQLYSNNPVIGSILDFCLLMFVGLDMIRTLLIVGNKSDRQAGELIPLLPINNLLFIFYMVRRTSRTTVLAIGILDSKTIKKSLIF